MPSILRKLGSSPAFTTIAVFTLAVGIGATTAIFTVVNGILLRPLHHPGAEELVVVEHMAPGLDLDEMPISDALYLHYREHGRGFEDIALYTGSSVNLTGERSPERVLAADVTASLFHVLRVAPALGTLFRDESEMPGAEPVVLLGDGLWRTRFGEDSDVIGRAIALDGVAHRILGVLPPEFSFGRPETALWRPLPLDPANTSLGSFGLNGVARLAPGVSPEAAEQDLDRLISNLAEAFPEDEGSIRILTSAGFAAIVQPLQDEVVGDVGQVLWLLLGSVGLILLIACANVANLFLARAETRYREIAIRTAMGATRGRILRDLLGESLVIGLLAGLAGLLLAAAGVRALIAFGPEDIPRLNDVGIDLRVVLFAIAISLLAGVLFGLLPALRAGSPILVSALKEGGGGSGTGRTRHRARNILVAAQVALALVLLIGCGLMVRSFYNLAHVDPGFDAGRVLTFRISLPENEYTTDESTASFIQRAADLLRDLPGVDTASAVNSPPLAGGPSGSGWTLEDFPRDEDELPPIHFFKINAPGYFETLRIPLHAGRTFEPADHVERRGVVIVNRAFARHYWSSAEAALGRRLQQRAASEPDPDDWYTIVGVVGNVRDSDLDEEPPELIYLPLAGKATEEPYIVRNVTFVVRTQGEPTSLAGPLRDAVWSLDPKLPIADLQPMTQFVERARAPMAFAMALLAIGAGVALILGGVGIYGVISYVVSQRTQEIGVRMALGAESRLVSAMVLRHGVLLALAGAVAGLVAAAALTRLMGALLFGVTPLDPATFAVVALLVVAVAALASYLPAQRAARVDPLIALRYE